MTRDTATRADIYTQAAQIIGHTLADHHIPADADLMAEYIELYWEMLQRGPVAINCTGGVVEFISDPRKAKAKA